MDEITDPSTQREITLYLEEFGRGNKNALDNLLPLVYEELCRNAHNLRFRFYNLDTLNTTAIVHETYLKLIRSGSLSFKSRAHFYFVASKAMRQILVNASLRKRALKNGGDEKTISLDDAGLPDIQLSEQTSEELLVVNEALEKLENQNNRHARIVECRFFGGMSVEETASALDISPATVKRSWNTARTWLYTYMNYG
jgi:RNA polymerase sigma factor (TIGR02999 family)